MAETAYEDRKVSYKEETIWKMLIIVSAFVMFLSGYLMVKQIYYKHFGKCIEMEYSGYNVKIQDAEGRSYSVDVVGTPVVIKDGKIRIYYFEGKEDKAIAYMNPLFDGGAFIIFTVLLCVSAFRIYRYHNPKVHSFNRSKYEKKEQEASQLAETVKTARVRIRKMLAQRDAQKRQRDCILLNKVPASEQEFINEFVKNQDKAFAKGDLYIGEIIKSPEKKGFKTLVCITGEEKYFENPLLLRDAVEEAVAEYASDIDKCTKLVKVKDMYFAGVVYQPSVCPALVREHQIYYFAANPAMNDYAVMLPAWYYSKEDFEYL